MTHVVLIEVKANSWAWMLKQIQNCSFIIRIHDRFKEKLTGFKSPFKRTLRGKHNYES